MLSQLKNFDLALKGRLPDHENLDDHFVAVGDLSVSASLDLYRINQREGKYKVLQKFFEQTEKLVGEQEFREIALKFIATHPSPEFTLTAFHPHFPGFISQHSAKDRILVKDLAMFEWAWHRLGRRNFQNQDPQLRASLSSQDPGGVRFVISETARVLRFEHRISEIYRTLKESADVEIRKERNFVMFFRPEPLTRKRMPLKMWQAHFIKLMQKNVNMAVAISNISSHTQVDPKMLGDFIDGLIESSVIVKVR